MPAKISLSACPQLVGSSMKTKEGQLMGVVSVEGYLLLKALIQSFTLLFNYRMPRTDTHYMAVHALHAYDNEQ